MGEPSELDRMGDGWRRETTIAPRMPVASETEMGTWIFLLKYDKHPSIGWQHRASSARSVKLAPPSPAARIIVRRPPGCSPN
jgi:hypothetical protein